VDLSHVVYEPAGAGPHATIVALHGWGATAFDLLGLAPHLAGGRLLVICPQGPLAVPLGPGANGFGWFPLTGGPPAGESVLAGIANRLEAFLAAALLRYPIDPRRLVLLGFSQGGVLAYRLALHEPSRFAAVVALSSWLPPPVAERVQPSPAYQRLPAFVQHGTADEVIAVARARASVERLRELGMPVTYREYAIGHEVSAESIRDLSAWLDETLR
jgi:phospholipase/carboxylesterase